MKRILSLFLLALSAACLHATVLYQVTTNYINGPIAGQGNWYISSKNPTNDIGVTNNVIYIASTNWDSIAAPTNGFYSDANGPIVYASFSIKVT